MARALSRRVLDLEKVTVMASISLPFKLSEALGKATGIHILIR